VPLANYGAAGLTDRSYSVGMLMFYALAQTLGAEGFDRAYRGFFQQYRDRGATTADFVAAFRRASPKSDRVLSDWLLTTRWYRRLASGETVRHMVDGYTAR
jgi:aminopeptidase N